jgi:MFS family permease
VKALDHAPFRRWLLVRAGLVTASQGISVAVGWQVYSLTGKALDLGLVGLFTFLPTLFLWPLTGLAADRYPRREIVRLSTALCVLVALGLIWTTRTPLAGPGPIFALMATFALARVFANPASQAIVAGLVPKENLPEALALSSATFQTLTMVAPALAGALVALTGDEAAVYGLALALYLLSSGLLMFIPPCRGSGQARGWRDVLEGLRYLRGRPVLLGAISIDLFAVLLGGATALLPVYAKDILEGGATSLGLLRAAPAVGAVGTALFLARHPMKRQVGRKMLAAVALFGLSTIAFGLSTSLFSALPALIVLGAADEVSVYLRQTLVQVRTPDEYRGRVSALNSVFVGISNEIGELESGLLASGVGPVRAVVMGGLGSIGVVLASLFLAPKLRDVDRVEEG